MREALGFSLSFATTLYTQIKSSEKVQHHLQCFCLSYLVLWDTESHTAQAGHMSSLCKKDDLGLTGERHPTGPSDRTQKPFENLGKGSASFNCTYYPNFASSPESSETPPSGFLLLYQ